MGRAVVALIPLALVPIIAGWWAFAASGGLSHRHGVDSLAFHNGVVLPAFGLATIAVVLAWVFEQRWLAAVALGLFAVAIVPDQYMIWKFVLVDRLHVTASHYATHIVNATLFVGGVASSIQLLRGGD